MIKFLASLILQDFWAVVEGCPVIAGYMFLFFCCLLIRKSEEQGRACALCVALSRIPFSLRYQSI